MGTQEILNEAAALIGERGAEYGALEVNFDRIRMVAAVLLNREVTRYEVAAILFATKVGRLGQTRKRDSFVDGINYLAFMAQFAEGDDVQRP